ncbi:hypothetical protein P171DRAFT_472763 [Karstenula rhodostoma CBS 690.94]|uniref:Uncharacterized protein n=1 Tax=Karstenula rhodostoma CBS 690.94 TaxID=1392251 RepID=A0A9P4PIV5_9PLEO|nr:hypothetical protein P171DRAFT_472763 [Karstenula rhodostoma CBS 690.94]
MGATGSHHEKSQTRARSTTESVLRACLAVNQHHADRALRDMERADPEEDEGAYVDLISMDEEEEYTSVALQAIFPRAFSLLAGLDWEGADAGMDGVFDG